MEYVYTTIHKYLVLLHRIKANRESFPVGYLSFAQADYQINNMATPTATINFGQSYTLINNGSVAAPSTTVH